IEASDARDLPRGFRIVGVLRDAHEAIARAESEDDLGEIRCEGDDPRRRRVAGGRGRRSGFGGVTLGAAPAEDSETDEEVKEESTHAHSFGREYYRLSVPAFAADSKCTREGARERLPLSRR